MSLLIRPARLEDAEGMRAVLNPIIRAGGTTAMEVEVTAEAQRDFLIGLGPDAICHVAVQGDEVLGHQTVEAHPQLPQDVGDIATFVAQAAQGRGVGRALADATFAAARSLGYGALNATIRADNDLGLFYYRRLGFREIGRSEAVPLTSGQRVDRIHHRLTL